MGRKSGDFLTPCFPLLVEFGLQLAGAESGCLKEAVVTNVGSLHDSPEVTGMVHGAPEFRTLQAADEGKFREFVKACGFRQLKHLTHPCAVFQDLPDQAFPLMAGDLTPEKHCFFLSQIDRKFFPIFFTDLRRSNPEQLAGLRLNSASERWEGETKRNLRRPFQ